jgi:hypothetical protein
MNPLPLKHIPSVIQKKYHLTEQREVAYAIAIENQIGLTDGPFFEIDQLLETIGEEKSVIIRFNADGTDDILYHWKNDFWIKQPTLKRK